MRTILNIFRDVKKPTTGKRRRRVFVHAVSGATQNKRKKAGVCAPAFLSMPELTWRAFLPAFPSWREPVRTAPRRRAWPARREQQEQPEPMRRPGPKHHR